MRENHTSSALEVAFPPKQLLREVLILPTLLLVTGCATIMHGTTQVVSISSTPSGATVIVDGGATHSTPCSLTLSRKREHTLLFQKPGHEDITFPVRRVTNEMVAGNILVGGLIGLGVDATTGASYKLVPPTVHVTLVPSQQVSVADVEDVRAKRPAAASNPCDIHDLPPVSEQASIAVMDLRVGDQLSAEIGRALGDVSRDAVQRTHWFILLDRENVVSILGEHDFQKAIQCDDTQCMVEYGKLLSVQKMLHGRVSMLGAEHIVYLSLTDVETGRIEATATEQVEGNVENIGRVIPDLVCRLLKECLNRGQAQAASGTAP